MEIVKKLKITSKKTEPFKGLNLEMVWALDGSELILTGDVMIRTIKRSTWEVESIKEIGHK